jgi:hypothetical protein
MGLFIPNSSRENSKNIGPSHWFRVALLILATTLLTWYGKIYKPKPSLAYINDFAVWMIPHKNGLGALVALSNDNNDFNTVRTGLRIWLSPPDSLLAFEEKSKIRYRGKNIIAIGDTLNEQLRQDIISTLDSTGNFFWLGPLSAELTGEDVSAELKLFSHNTKDYVFDLIYEGHKIRFFGSQTALDSSEAEPLSVAVLMFSPKDENTPPLQKDGQVQSLIWRGKNEDSADPSRIALNYPEAMALISYNERRGLYVKRMRIKDWRPDY